MKQYECGVREYREVTVSLMKQYECGVREYREVTVLV
jgi:hypothetical protein